MLSKTKVLGLMLAATMVFTSSMLVYAENGAEQKDWHQGKKDHMHMMAKILNLSDDQEKQLKDSHQKQKEAMKAIFTQIKSNREAFSAEIVKATPDMNKVNDLQTQIKTLQSQMIDNSLSSTLEVKKIMTPEQFAGYMALKKAKRMMVHEGHDKFGHMDGKDKDGHKHWGGDQDSDSQE